ncbi:hypothetical protein KY347_06770 [Candidatus Woesearchaeota archaeon]|nr:hypothetical protein [Candidatus Woesearchaeota archaeon]
MTDSSERLEKLVDAFENWHRGYGKFANVDKRSLEYLRRCAPLSKKPEGEPEREEFLSGLYWEIGKYLSFLKVEAVTELEVNSFIKHRAELSSKRAKLPDGFYNQDGSFEHDETKASVGLFASYLVNECVEEREVTLEIDRPWNNIGVFTPKGKEIEVIVNPPPEGDETLWYTIGRRCRILSTEVGEYCAAYLNGGTVIVKANPDAKQDTDEKQDLWGHWGPINVDRCCGRGMKAGKVTIKGHGGQMEGMYMSGGDLSIIRAWSPGWYMCGGRINIEEGGGDIGKGIVNGTIISKGAHTILGVPQKGQIEVYGDISSMVGDMSFSGCTQVIPGLTDPCIIFYTKGGAPMFKLTAKVVT